MRYLLLAIIAFAPCSNAAAAEKNGDMRPITIDDLNTRPVIGQLGVPLGTAVEISATVVAGDPRTKHEAGKYFLRVTEVAGKKLESRPKMEFVLAPASNASLAKNNFELHEMKHDRRVGRLTDRQIEALQRGYVGKAVRLKAYELGRFHGLPKNRPADDLPFWAESGFGFSTYLRVMSEYK